MPLARLQLEAQARGFILEFLKLSKKLGIVSKAVSLKMPLAGMYGGARNADFLGDDVRLVAGREQLANLLFCLNAETPVTHGCPFCR